MTPSLRTRSDGKSEAKTRVQKQVERRATAPERRRATIAARYGMYGDDQTPGYPLPKPKPKSKRR